MGIYGQDWASYQPSTPDTRGLSFVFVKVTEGLTYTSPRWRAQRDHARAHDLVLGFYHYPHMGDDPHAEADRFLAQAAPAGGDMLVLDWEGYDRSNAGVPKSRQLAYRDAWLTYVKERMPDHAVGLYCNTDYWLNVDTTGTYGDFLWIATAGRPAGQPGIEAPWLFHQYSSAGDVDHDYCRFADAAELRAWTLSFGVPPGPPAPEPVVSLAHVVAAARHDPPGAQGHTTYPAEVRIVESALRAEGLLDKRYATDGSFGYATVAAYAAWQRRLGYTGADADGIPGHTSLAALGRRHGFTVVG